jgi:uncharacterized protein
MERLLSKQTYAWVAYAGLFRYTARETQERRMSHDSLTRRGFLSGIAAVGGTTLLPQPSPASVRKNEDAASIAVHPLIDKVPLKAQAFPMGEVRLTPGLFLDMMETNRSYLYSLPNDRLAYNFRVTAGISTDATPLGGWEAPDGLLCAIM